MLVRSKYFESAMEGQRAWNSRRITRKIRFYNLSWESQLEPEFLEVLSRVAT